MAIPLYEKTIEAMRELLERSDIENAAELFGSELTNASSALTRYTKTIDELVKEPRMLTIKLDYGEQLVDESPGARLERARALIEEGIRREEALLRSAELRMRSTDTLRPSKMTEDERRCWRVALAAKVAESTRLDRLRDVSVAVQGDYDDEIPS